MNARQFFLLFSLCALVPFAAAKLSLSYGWFNTESSTNKGEWLEQEVQLLPPIPKGDIHWTIAYVSGADCLSPCRDALTLLRNIHLGLGRKQLGVQAMHIAVTAEQGSPGEIVPGVGLTLVSLDHAQQQLLAEQFVIINQRGLVLLRYPFANANATQVAANLRSDLLRLFNYDRSRL